MKSNRPDMRGLPEEFLFLSNFDIEEVEADPNEKQIDIADGGEVEPWKRLEHLEEAKIRKYITGTIIVLWIVWTLAGLTRFFYSGDTLLLITSPAMISVPLFKVLSYYFRSG